MPNLTLKERLVDYDPATGRMRSTPRQLFLETSSRCNLTCVHCPVDFGRADGPAKLDMPPAVFRKLEPWLLDAHYVNLNYVGEPLVSPHLPELLEICSGGSAEVSFNTNGVLLTTETCEMLVRSGVHSISVSIDGTKSMLPIRGVSYELVRDRLRELEAVKQRLGSETPHVAIAYVMMKRNAYELPKVMRDLLPGGGIHAVHVQPLVVLYETLRDENPYRDPYAQDALDEAEEVAAAHGVRFITFRSNAPNDERFTGGSPLYGQLGQVSEAFGCVDPFYEIKIRSTGDVYACSYGRTPDLNVADLELDEVWNHPWYLDLRRALHAGRFEGLCARCPFVFGSAEAQEDSLRTGVHHSQEARFLRGGYGRRTPPPETAPAVGFDAP